MTTPIPSHESVLFACQQALREVRNAGRTPQWLILGNEEWHRLQNEITPLLPAGPSNPLVEFQGTRVAHYNVPSHLEVGSIP